MGLGYVRSEKTSQSNALRATSLSNTTQGVSMQTQIEKLDGLKHKLTIQVEWQEIDQKESQKLKEVAKKANIPGFRQGKVPASIVKQRYGESIRHEVLTDVMQNSLKEVIEKESLDFAGQPDVQFDNEQTKEGELFVFTIGYESYPAFEVNELDNLPITQITAKITDADIEKTLLDLQKQQAEWNDVDRAAKDGDTVIIDFTGFVDGEKFEGGEATGHRLVLGSGSMIPGFEDGIIGMKKDDEKTIDVTFPKDYHHDGLAGKPTQFLIKVSQVQESVLLPLDDAFAEKFDVKEGGIAKLREDMRQKLETEMATTLRHKNTETLFNMLLENNKFDLPEVMLINEQKHMKQQREEQYKQRFGAEHAPDVPLEEFIKGAERRVALSLIIKAIIKKHNISIDEKKVDELFKERFAGMGDLDMLKNYFRQNEQFMESMNFQALELQVIEKLLGNMQIKNEEQSFLKVMRGEDAE